MHPLDGPFLKAQRAKFHLNTLQRNIDAFIERHPHTLSEYNSGKYREYFIHRSGYLPVRWGLLVGDFAHNLRSALDHIIYEINIRVANPIREERCQFPIFDTRVQYRNRGIMCFPKEPRGIRKVVDSFQPYHRGNSPELKLLSLLRDLDNADKHRTIIPVFDQTEFTLSEYIHSPGFPNPVFDIDHGGYRVLVTQRVQERIGSIFNPSLSAEVVFDVKERSTGKIYRIGMPTLHSIYILVKNHIIPQFRGFFFKPRNTWRGYWIVRPLRHK